jgi:sirohydrochlorin ferrochelatase
VVGTTNADGLLTERQVADQSGLAAELESNDETGLWRAKVAKLLLDSGVRMKLVKVAVREPLSVAELRATVENANAWAGRSV